MFTQVITPTEASIVLRIPEELRGHTLRVTLDDVNSENQPSPGDHVFRSVEEVQAHFKAGRIETRGWKFDRAEANRRR